MVVMMGNTRITSAKSIVDETRFITFIWSCTNFLVPKTNG